LTLQQQIRANRRRSALVILLFSLLVLAVGAAAWVGLGQAIGVFVLAVGIAYGVFAVLNAGGMVGSLTRARVITKADDPELYRLVENVSIAAGLPSTPTIRLISDAAPNAFATGLRARTTYIAVTTGLRQLMPRRELEAVIAHEIAHVRNRDTRLMTLAAVLVGVVALISDLAFRAAFFGGGRRSDSAATVIPAVIGLLLAPLAAFLLQMALSRRREYLADASAAAYLNDPEAMALALRRLQLDTREVAYADRSTAHLFIESPTRYVRGPGAVLGGLFQTHPPLEARIRALEEAGGFRLPPLTDADAVRQQEWG
jgi:heat shock protein HtpX